MTKKRFDKSNLMATTSRSSAMIKVAVKNRQESKDEIFPKVLLYVRMFGEKKLISPSEKETYLKAGFSVIEELKDNV